MKIAYVTPDATDALAFYRGSGPLSHLRKNYPDFDYEQLASDINWSSLRRFDAVFLQRPWLADHLKVCEIAEKWGIPLILDYDDWLYELPVSNPAAGVFKANQKNFSQIVNMATHIMVTTLKLSELIRGILLDQNKPITVVPNAYDRDLFKHYRHEKNFKERTMRFCWRGGNSHLADLLSAKQDYHNLFASYPEWQFIFIAQNPWILDAGKFKNVQTAEPLGISEYFRAFHDTAPAILAHPLEDNEFNRSKSMCSWLEATHARAAFIGPDFEEFKRPGIINYNASKSFFECAAELLNEPQRIATHFWDSENYIRENLDLSVVNMTRYNVFKQAIQTR